MNVAETVAGLSYNEKLLLRTLETMGPGTSSEAVFENGGFERDSDVMNAASWLQNKGLIVIDEEVRKLFTLSDRTVVSDGLPERRALVHIDSEGGSVPLSSLADVVGAEDAPIAIGWLRRKGLADITKTDEGKIISISDAGRAALDSEMPDEVVLESLANGELDEIDIDPKVLKDLRSRQTILGERVEVSRRMSLTADGDEAVASGLDMRREVAQLTPELIQSGGWRDVSFRRYDVKTYAPSAYPAKRHPLTRIADEVRDIMVSMGFEEIDSEFVQPAFWNMDVLFTPQDHPARDLHDTFYLRSPSRIPIDDEALVSKVKAIHEDGGDTGSKGWGYEWSRDEAERALLRTHTTVNTIRHIAENPEPPAKVFSISRLFRKEAIDSTHLPEFTQIEGIVMTEDASFDMLVTLLKEFYARMGFDTIRIRPGYFPYTEPSLEVDVMFNGSWMELGGAGIFRPEVTAPFGVDCNVLAWGLGFERLAMLRWGIKDIRDLYVSDVELLRKSPLL